MFIKKSQIKAFLHNNSNEKKHIFVKDMQIIYIILLIIPTIAFSQKYSYKLLVYGEEVGILTAEKTKKNDNQTLYKVNSSGKVKMIFTISSKYSSLSKMKNNELIYSKSILYKNNNLIDTVVVKKINEKYYSETALKKHPTQIIGKITYVANMLYFTEPKGIKNRFPRRKVILLM